MSEFADYIGRSATAEEVISPAAVDRFRATLEPHLAPGEGEAAPLGIHWCIALDAAPMHELARDGHPAKGGFLPPIRLPRRMWAGSELEILGPLMVGDRVTRRATVADVTTKEGRSGALTFVVVDHECSTARGAAIRERQSIVYRDAATDKPAAEAARPQEAPQRDCVWTVDPSPALLFRYSALTFNAHRIHYDHPYVTNVEGYAGLVVHGPLQATLLLNAAAATRRQAPRKFVFRGVAPLIADAAFDVCAEPGEGQAMECWVRSASGRTTMKATAHW